MTNRLVPNAEYVPRTPPIEEPTPTLEPDADHSADTASNLTSTSVASTPPPVVIPEVTVSAGAGSSEAVEVSATTEGQVGSIPNVRTTQNHAALLEQINMLSDQLVSLKHDILVAHETDRGRYTAEAVSYTHLTLPTILLV